MKNNENIKKQNSIDPEKKTLFAVIATMTDTKFAYKQVFPAKCVEKTETQIAQTASNLAANMANYKELSQQVQSIMSSLVSPDVETSLRENFKTIRKMSETLSEAYHLFPMLLHKDPSALTELLDDKREIGLWLKNVRITEGRDGVYRISGIELKQEAPLQRLVLEVGRDLQEKLERRILREKEGISVKRKKIIIEEVADLPDMETAEVVDAQFKEVVSRPIKGVTEVPPIPQEK